MARGCTPQVHAMDLDRRIAVGLGDVDADHAEVRELGQQAASQISCHAGDQHGFHGLGGYFGCAGFVNVGAAAGFVGRTMIADGPKYCWFNCAVMPSKTSNISCWYFSPPRTRTMSARTASSGTMRLASS